MKPVYTRSLIIEFPQLFRHARPGSNSTMIYGIAIGNGWYDILYQLCVGIQRRAVEHRVEPPAFDQIKEKFGGLRVHMFGSKDYRDLIELAEKQAWKTCEHCGAPGTLRQEGWHHVSCDRCETDRERIQLEGMVAYNQLEKAGGIKKVIEEAFAEVDAKSKCECGINKDVCERTARHDPDICQRVAAVRAAKAGVEDE